MADFRGNVLRMIQMDFDKADTDKSGCLSKDEMVKVLVDNGVYKGTAERIFDIVDKNNDAKISRNEFINAMKGTPELTMREWELGTLFKKMDKNNDGSLTKDEILGAAKMESTVGLSVDDAFKLVSFLRTDKDGKIDYQEFLRAFGMQQSATLMGQIFTKLDNSNDGTLSRQEMMDAVATDEELKINKQQIMVFLRSLGEDPNKKLNYREFCELWMASINRK